MAKVAIVTDSNSGITQKEAGKLGVFVLPMPFTVDNETYLEDVNLTQKEFYEKLKGEASIYTSQPSPDAVMKLWDDVLKEYDEIVHIPMSSGLSGSCQTAMMLAQDYEDKVYVVNNQRISVTLRQSVIDGLELVKRGKSAAEIAKILEDDKFNSSIYITLDTLHYLKKGGRLTPAVAAIGTLLRIKPVLQIQGEKLDTFAKARTTKQGKGIMMDAIKSDMENRFKTDYTGMHLQIAHTENEEAAELLRDELLELYPGSEIVINPLSLSVSCHIGPGALAIAVCKKMNYDEM